MKKTAIAASLREFVLLLVSLGILSLLSLPLADLGSVLGRANRYLGAVPTELFGLTPPLLAIHFTSVISFVALAGWIALLIGRQGGPAGAIAALAVAIWSAGLALIADLATDAAPWWIGAAIALSMLPIAARLTRAHWQAPQQPSRVWLYPVWVLLTGLGQLWLLDYSARSYAQHAALGLQQFHALAAAYVLLTIGAGLRPTLTATLERTLARLDGVPLALNPARHGSAAQATERARAWWSRIGLLMVFALWVAGVLMVVGLAPRQSSLRAELIRMAAYVLMGWLAYRWIDISGGTRQGTQRGLAAGCALLALVVLPMLITRDNGQMLLVILAVAVLLGAGLGAVFRRPGLSALFGSSLSAGLLAGAVWALYELGPKFSQTVLRRVEALINAFESHYEYLSELRWFMGNAPSGGYQLGQVPWCGTLGSLTSGECNAIPRQTQSDYVLAAITGVWGAPVAWAITALTAAWLIGLVRAADLPVVRNAMTPQANRLAMWIVTTFVAVSLVQLFVTCFGSLGQMPLTGVTFPLLSFGRAGLLVTAVFAALSLNRSIQP